MLQEFPAKVLVQNLLDVHLDVCVKGQVLKDLHQETPSPCRHRHLYNRLQMFSRTKTSRPTQQQHPIPAKCKLSLSTLVLLVPHNGPRQFSKVFVLASQNRSLLPALEELLLGFQACAPCKQHLHGKHNVWLCGGNQLQYANFCCSIGVANLNKQGCQDARSCCTAHPSIALRQLQSQSFFPTCSQHRWQRLLNFLLRKDHPQRCSQCKFVIHCRGHNGGSEHCWLSQR
mmetsp:Transcript_33588/g.72348  ORF Transcript_33588/g.72348 Transcript_33588/m.72348 type:complete len:229 (+) Transcript_33588:579-1265(+)